MLVFVVLPLLDEDAELEGFKFLFEGVSFRNASFTILLVQVVGKGGEVICLQVWQQALDSFSFHGIT